MNPRSNANQRKRYVADPPKSDGGTLFNKEGGTPLYILPRVSSHDNNAGRQTNPSTVIPGTDPHLFAIHRRRGGGGGGVLQAPISSAQIENDNNISEEQHINTPKRPSVGDRIPTAILVILWYCLGIISIATSKILLSAHRVPPLLLTLQQLLIGMILLRTLLYYTQTNHTANERKDLDADEYTLNPKGLQPVPLQMNTNTVVNSDCEVGRYKRKSSNEETIIATQNRSSSGIFSALLALANPSSSAINHRIHHQLLLSSIYFTIGFLLTNVGFRTGSAAFVETVKAAEPITSAATAVFWGIERLGPFEVASLGGIIIGVVCSTLGHVGSSSTPSNGNELIPPPSSPSQSLLTSSCIVLLANLCFSFRGLHQKLFRATPQGNTAVIDDMNLQFRMQQIGFLLLSIPAVLGYMHLPSRLLYEGLAFRYLLRYFLLCVINGVAFASYNLSSTMILSRISIVHHAALNCIRRVFAIVVTSVVFGLQITFLQIVGIICSVCAFFSYIHFKSKKSLQQSKRREMMKKWDSIMLDAKRSKWAASGKTSSSLPMGSADESLFSEGQVDNTINLGRRSD